MFQDQETKTQSTRESGQMHFDARTFRRVSFCPSLWLPLLVTLQLHGDGVRHEPKVGEALVAVVELVLMIAL